MRLFIRGSFRSRSIIPSGVDSRITRYTVVLPFLFYDDCSRWFYPTCCFTFPLSPIRFVRHSDFVVPFTTFILLRSRYIHVSFSFDVTVPLVSYTSFLHCDLRCLFVHIHRFWRSTVWFGGWYVCSFPLPDRYFPTFIPQEHADRFPTGTTYIFRLLTVYHIPFLRPTTGSVFAIWVGVTYRWSLPGHSTLTVCLLSLPHLSLFTNVVGRRFVIRYVPVLFTVGVDRDANHSVCCLILTATSHLRCSPLHYDNLFFIRYGERPDTVRWRSGIARALTFHRRSRYTRFVCSLIDVILDLFICPTRRSTGDSFWPLFVSGGDIRCPFRFYLTWTRCWAPDCVTR